MITFKWPDRNAKYFQRICLKNVVFHRNYLEQNSWNFIFSSKCNILGTLILAKPIKSLQNRKKNRPQRCSWHMFWAFILKLAFLMTKDFRNDRWAYHLITCQILVCSHVIFVNPTKISFKWFAADEGWLLQELPDSYFSSSRNETQRYRTQNNIPKYRN